MKGTYIEIVKCYDLYHKITDKIFYNEVDMDVKTLTDEFCKLYGLESIKDLPLNMLEDSTKTFVDFLKSKGFIEIKTNEVIFSD